MQNGVGEMGVGEHPVNYPSMHSRILSDLAALYFKNVNVMLQILSTRIWKTK